MFPSSDLVPLATPSNEANVPLVDSSAPITGFAASTHGQSYAPDSVELLYVDVTLKSRV